MQALARRTQSTLGISFGLLALLWVIEGCNLLLGGALDRYGIRPRDPNALAGILWAPFVHLSLAHLVANSAPLVVLSSIVLLRGVRTFILVSLVVLLLGGFGAWLIGRPFTIEVGASGVIFGYLGYLLARGVVERSAGAVLIALLVLALYGGALWGMLPLQTGVAFEGHITGFLSGGLAARLVGRRRVAA